MMRVFAPLLIPAAFGLVLSVQGNASALCHHGLFRCWHCGDYGYGQYSTGAPVPTGSGMTPSPGGLTAPAGRTNPTGSAQPPAFASPMAFPGTGWGVPAYSYPAYASPYYAAPATPFSPGAAPMGQVATPPTFLSGYDPNAPIAPIFGGMALSTGHLIGSHIFQVLGQIGAGLNRDGLIQQAINTFIGTTRFSPTGGDVEILKQIVDRFLGNAGPGPAGPGGTPTTTTTTLAAGSNVIRIVITLEVPPGTQVMGVQSQGRPSGQGAAIPGGNDSAGSAAPSAPPTPEPSIPAPGSDLKGGKG